MIKIKLSRLGKKGFSHYRIVVAERRSARDGKFIDNLGYYSPMTEPNLIKLDRKKLEYWLKKGAQPTDTVKMLIKKNG